GQGTYRRRAVRFIRPGPPASSGLAVGSAVTHSDSDATSERSRPSRSGRWRAGRTRRQRARRGERRIPLSSPLSSLSLEQRRERSPLSATRSLCPPPSPHSNTLLVGSRPYVWCSPVWGKTRRLRLGYASTSVFSRAPSRASQTLIRGASLVHSASR